jgi:hypothetical protein
MIGQQEIQQESKQENEAGARRSPQRRVLPCNDKQAEKVQMMMEPTKLAGSRVGAQEIEPGEDIFDAALGEAVTAGPSSSTTQISYPRFLWVTRTEKVSKSSMLGGVSAVGVNSAGVTAELVMARSSPQVMSKVVKNSSKVPL